MQLIRQIYSELYNGRDIVDMKEVIRLFERKPELAKINARIKQKSEREVDERYFKK
jgi:spore coat polysaccharide biosynthesis protein SpsF (cytidylyltransferase family)